MKNAILKFLLSRAGGILTPIIAGLVGAAVAELAKLDPSLAGGVDQAAVVGFVVAGILSAVNYWTNGNTREGVKAIQRDLDVRVDGVPGPVTRATVQAAVSAAMIEEQRKVSRAAFLKH